MSDKIASENLEDVEHVEIKKELSDDYEMMLSDCDMKDDCIFEVIPFMAKLLSNLKCSFYSRNNEIVIASIELVSVEELIERLVQNKIAPSRMDCGNDSTFALSICDDQFNKTLRLNNANLDILRFLPHMATVTECTSLSLHIDNGEIHVRSVSYDALASLMSRLKLYDIRPKQVDSMKDSLFSIAFNEDSFPNNPLPTRVLSSDFSNDVINARRPRICPNYLRDYVVEDKDPPASGLDLLPVLFPRSSFSSSVSFLETDTTTPRFTDLPVGKRGRGRPRIKPKPCDLSLDSNQMKRPRGRPRRSDIVPNVIARTNSFINIQPKGLTARELESCFVKFLESDIVAMRQSK